MILSERKYAIKPNGTTPNLSKLLGHRADYNKERPHFSTSDYVEWRSLQSFLQNAINSLIGGPAQLKKLALEQTKQYMLHRIEPDGTFLGYFSSTFLMIFALLSLGYSNSHPIIKKAVAGLKAMKCEIDGLPHMQYTTATVWNTALLNYALQEAGIPLSDPMIKKATEYLLSRQHFKYGDWSIRNPDVIPGGWGFADKNTIHPDVDDTSAALRSLSRSVPNDLRARTAWNRGVQWLLSMQNRDGGFPAFEKNTNQIILKLLPIEKADFILADPAAADLTGRTLEFFGSYTNLPRAHSTIQAGIEWLLKNQEKNGSWYGRWGICYIYGTWGALTGLEAVGVSPSQSAIVKAVKWLEDIQNRDGGWGESCTSDSKRQYIRLQSSTLTHTVWAVDALISVCDEQTPAIKKGIKFILENLEKDDWTTDYPKGQGMAGDFYIHYHSYRYIFPILALAHYRKKYL